MTITYSLDQITTAARQLIETAHNRPVWLFDGQMGAGKTTLIREVCRQLGVAGAVQSPTFSIVNEYVTAAGDPIYHFDCYRLKNETEALDIGVEEYFDSGHYCLVEWPDKIENLLPNDAVRIALSMNPDQNRTLTFD